jgi:hypothetical protein
VIFGFAPSQELLPHTARMAASLYSVGGEAKLEEMQAGAFTHMPLHLQHGIFSRTPVVIL